MILRFMALLVWVCGAVLFYEFEQDCNVKDHVMPNFLTDFVFQFSMMEMIMLPFSGQPCHGGCLQGSLQGSDFILTLKH